jgi:hypothetical protein
METGMTMQYDERHGDPLVEKINSQVNIFLKIKENGKK